MKEVLLLSRVKNVQLGIPNHRANTFPVVKHVGRRQMVLKVTECFPLFDDHDTVRILMLPFKIADRVDGCGIFDATRFGPDLGDNLVEFDQEGFSAARNEVNLGNYMNHRKIVEKI